MEENTHMAELYRKAAQGSRHFIRRTTDDFFTKFQEKDRFSVTVKTAVTNSMPQKYNERLIARVNRLVKIAESGGYDMKFYKWKLTHEYCWVFTREGK